MSNPGLLKEAFATAERDASNFQIDQIAFLIGKGTLPAGDYGAVVTGFVSLLTALWSVHSNPTGKTIK